MATIVADYENGTPPGAFTVANDSGISVVAFSEQKLDEALRTLYIMHDTRQNTDGRGHETQQQQIRRKPGHRVSTHKLKNFQKLDSGEQLPPPRIVYPPRKFFIKITKKIFLEECNLKIRFIYEMHDSLENNDSRLSPKLVPGQSSCTHPIRDGHSPVQHGAGIQSGGLFYCIVAPCADC